MVPLPFLFAALCLWAIVRVAQSDRDGRWAAIAALGFAAVQLTLVGLRFGYGLTGLVPVQQLVAAILPVVVLAAFVPFPTGWTRYAAALPLLAVGLSLWLAPGMVDPLIALTAMTVAARLVWLGLRPGPLPLAPLGQGLGDRGWLWGAAVMLILTALADLGALALGVMGQGDKVGGLIGGIMVLAFGAVVWLARRPTPAPDRDLPEHADLFARLESVMQAGLYQDADLTLGRIARRLSVPQRDISQAVNRQTGENLSQYVNGHRVRAACALLRQTDRTVTDIHHAVGFATKSNFHREFARITGQTPGDWRRGG